MSTLNLSASDVKQLQQLAEDDPSPRQQHAQAVLLAEEGFTTDEIAAATHLTRRQVLYWLRQFQQHGLARLTDETAETAPDLPSPVNRPLTAPKQPGLTAQDSMALAGCKLLFYHFQRMLVEETPVRENRHGEAIHDMRVATRRLRSTLELFEGYFRKRPIKPFRKPFRDLAGALGEVRDLEVITARTTADLDQLEPALHSHLQPLLENYQRDLETARASLLDLLDSSRYAGLLEDFSDFLDLPVESVARDSDSLLVERVCYVVPALAWEAYSRCRVYTESMDNPSLDTLHQLRIDTKRFRYLLEGFEEVLGPEIAEVIKAAKALQDHLGLLQDARVAVERNLDFVQHMQQTQPELPVAGVLRYVALRSEEQQRLLAGLPQQWAAFTAPALRQAMARSLSVL